MNPNSEHIQKVVTLVLQRLESLRELKPADFTANSNSSPRLKPCVVNETSTKNPNANNSFQLNDKVVSLDSLRKLPNHFQSTPVRKRRSNISTPKHCVILDESSIVTPSAKEWLADRGIGLEIQKCSRPDEVDKSKTDNSNLLHSSLVLLSEQGSWLDKKHWIESHGNRETFRGTFQLPFDQIVMRCRQQAHRGDADLAEPVIVIATSPHLMCSILNRDDSIRAAAVNESTCMTRLQIEMQPNMIVVDGKRSNDELLMSVVNSLRTSVAHDLNRTPHSQIQGAPK